MVENSDFRQESISNVINLLEDGTYIKRSRQDGGKKSFCRRRKLPFPFLIVLLIQGLQRSLQRDLDRFFQRLLRSEHAVPHFTKGAFSKSRSQLKPSAFSELNEVALRPFYQNAPYKTFEDFRVLAVDGSTLCLPRHPSVEKRFGLHHFGPKADSPRSLARTSLLYDVCNLTVLDGRMEGFATSELALLQQHLDKVQPSADLLVLDRGYANWNLMADLQARGLSFVIRVGAQWWHVVRAFIQEGAPEQWVEVAPQVLQGGSLRLRLVRVELEDGTVEVLCTNIDGARLAASCFQQLYHLRWELEEAYKLLKTRLQLEAFSGKTALAVEQDFQAALFAMTMTAILCFPVAEKLSREAQDLQEQKRQAGCSARKHPRKINRAAALSKVKDHAIQLFLHRIIDPTLDALTNCFEKFTEIVRPNRHFQRKKKTRQPPNQYYKPL